MPIHSKRQDMIIPHELWCQAFVYLAPIDVISLGQTCRSLKALVSEKSVWITILTSICQEQALFKPSYPVQDMDVAQLQRAAMGPTLFQRRLTKGAIPADKLNEAKELEPASIVELDGLLEAAGPNSTAPSIDARRWNVHRRLIPGGRFLAHVKHLKPQRSGLDSQMEESDELKSFLVEIWDLGVAGSAPLSNPILLANKRFTRGASQHVISVVAFYTEEAPESLRLLIALGGDDFVMKVFSISGLGEGNPSIQEAAALRVDTNPVTESLHDGEEPIFRGDLVLTRLDDTIIILWNFSRGLYTILRIDDDGYVARRYAFYDNRIIFTGRLLFMFFGGWGKGEICVWKVPSQAEFTQVESDSKVNLFIDQAYTTPDITLPVELPEAHEHMFASFNVPVASTTLPISFDAFVSAGARGMAARAGKMTPRRPAQGARFIIGYTDPCSPHDISSNDLGLDVKRVASFAIRPPVTGPATPAPYFAPALSNSSLSVAFLDSGVKEYTIAGEKGQESATFAYTLSPGGPPPVRKAGPSAGVKNTDTTPASVSVLRLVDANKRPRWSACPASGRLVTVASNRRGYPPLLIDYLHQ